MVYQFMPALMGIRIIIDDFDQLPFSSYSRKILWLEVEASNTSDPAHIAHYYLTVVKKIGGMLLLSFS